MTTIKELAQRIADYNNAVYIPDQYHAPITADDVIEVFESDPTYAYSSLLEDYSCEYFTPDFTPAAVAQIISEVAENVPGAVERYCYIFFKDGDVISGTEEHIGSCIGLNSFDHAKVCHTGIDKDGEVGEIYDYTIKVSRDPARK